MTVTIRLFCCDGYAANPTKYECTVEFEDDEWSDMDDREREDAVHPLLEEFVWDRTSAWWEEVGNDGERGAG